jgi:hypothetical protein
VTITIQFSDTPVRESYEFLRDYIELRLRVIAASEARSNATVDSGRQDFDLRDASPMPADRGSDETP